MGKPYAYNVTPAYVPDGVHPNALGHDSIAHVIHRAILEGPTTVFLELYNAHGAFTGPRIFSGMQALPAGLYGSGRLFSLDGKSRPRQGRPLSAGAYVLRAR